MSVFFKHIKRDRKMETNKSIQVKWPKPGDVIKTEAGMDYTIGASVPVNSD